MQRDHLLVETIKTKEQNKQRYNKFTTGVAGGELVADFDITRLTPDERFEFCEDFIREHETDCFRTGRDLVYLGDDAFPDAEQHTNYLHHTQYDAARYEYDMIVATRKIKKANQEAKEARVAFANATWNSYSIQQERIKTAKDVWRKQR